MIAAGYMIIRRRHHDYHRASSLRTVTSSRMGWVEESSRTTVRQRVHITTESGFYRPGGRSGPGPEPATTQMARGLG